jgi:hypothetical protein
MNDREMKHLQMDNLQMKHLQMNNLQMNSRDMNNKDMYKNIERLIARFFDGETTLEEEQQLYHFFRQPELPQELESYRQVFAYFEEGIKQEDTPQEKSLQEKFLLPPPDAERRERNRLLRLSIGIAASFLLLLWVGFRWLHPSQEEPYRIARNGVVITDPVERQKAYQEVKQQVRAQYDEIINSFPDEQTREAAKRVIYGNQDAGKQAFDDQEIY